MRDELKAKIALAVAAILFSIIGMTLVIYYSNWQVGLGIFSLFWGNNIINSLGEK